MATTLTVRSDTALTGPQAWDVAQPLIAMGYRVEVSDGHVTRGYNAHSESCLLVAGHPGRCIGVL